MPLGRYVILVTSMINDGRFSHIGHGVLRLEGQTAWGVWLRINHCVALTFVLVSCTTWWETTLTFHGLQAIWLKVEFFCRGFVDLYYSDHVANGLPKRISPKCCGDNCCEVHPPSVQWPHSRRNVSAVEHQVPAKGRVLVQPRVLAKVPTSRGHVTLQRDSHHQFQIKSWRRPHPESPNSSKCLPRWARKTTCTLLSRKHFRRGAFFHLGQFRLRPSSFST